jgi:uncharacterized membrane protein
MIEIFVSGALGAVIGCLGTYVIGRKLLNTDRLLGFFDEITAEVMLNEEYQRRIYSIGALVGKGIMDGTGFKRNVKRKGGLEGLIMDVAGAFIGQEIQKRQIGLVQPTQKVIDLAKTTS